MKTKSKIQKELQLLKGNKTEFTSDEKRQIETLKSLILFVETNPSEDSVKRQRENLEKKIITIESRFLAWEKSNPALLTHIKNPEQHYATINNLPKLKFQLSNLNFLLA